MSNTGLTDVTICLTAHPVSDHPSITHIRAVIESLVFLEGIEGVKILLAHDGNNGALISDDTYDAYFTALTEYLKTKAENFQILKRNTRGFLVGNLISALEHVDSNFILFVQHDVPFVRELNITSIVQDMGDNPAMKHVRFNRRYNYLKKVDTKIGNIVWEEYEARNKYIKTNAFSACNNISRTDYIYEILASCDKPSPEKYVNRWSEKPRPWIPWNGTYIYDGFMAPPVTRHNDARVNEDYWSKL